ncbi:MAG: hypothetical protein FJ102_14960 [Deltaproteobacteria bacterium]|nr:hypothetical protein [Deltaproteobacteria bacterium]
MFAPFLLATALAQEPAPGDATAPPADPAVAEKKRPFLMEVNFRGRYMTVPTGTLDLWSEAHEDDEYPARPDVNAYTLGLEFVIKEKSANGIFYIEFFKPLIEDGYWDDIDHGSPDPLDGSWVDFSDEFSFVNIGANYAYELHATKWLSFLFGAGLGMGIKIGNVYEWQPGEDPSNPEGNNDNYDVDCGSDAAAYDRADPDGYNCHYDAEIFGDVPVIPMIDINIGVRFNINDRAAIRLEGGLHDMFYGGGAVGVVF